MNWKLQLLMTSERFQSTFLSENFHVCRFRWKRRISGENSINFAVVLQTHLDADKFVISISLMNFLQIGN